MSNASLTQSEIKQILHYDQDTGIFTWKVNRTGTALAGTVAGKMTKGRVQIKINGKRYYAHRLAWIYVYGEWPTQEIDHINLVMDDNRIENLRQATHQQNNWNKKCRKGSRSGHKGVCFDKSSSKWRSECMVNGSRKLLGYFPTPEEASEAYTEYAKKHHGEFFCDENITC